MKIRSSKVLLASASLLLFVPACLAQLNCGPRYANALCGADAPCCSEFGFCGTTPAQCGGGCVEAFSGPGSCYASRAGGRTCVSGHYRMGDTNSTWLVPTDAYNGNPQTADFTVDRAGIAPTNLRMAQGNAHITLTAPVSGLTTEQGNGVRFSSTSYISQGSSVTLRVRPSGSGGVVTAFITMSDDLDEIDWEWTGNPASLGVGQSNVFAKGLVDYTNSGLHFPGRRRSANLRNEFHNWTITWTPTALQWSIDGVVVRTESPTTLAGTYPVSPARVQIAVWDGGYAAAGTRTWAGGFVNFAAPIDDRTAIIESVTIRCAGDPVPVGPPVRPTGWYPPNLQTAVLNQVVPGLPGYDEEHTGAGKISIANLETQLQLNPGSLTTLAAAAPQATTRGVGASAATNVPALGNGTLPNIDANGAPLTVGAQFGAAGVSRSVNAGAVMIAVIFFILL